MRKFTASSSRSYNRFGRFPYRSSYDLSHCYERKRKKPAESDKLASAESKIQEEHLSEATTSTSSSMQTAAAPPIKLLEDVIPPQEQDSF